jgi:hypothetical protein
MIDIDKLRGKLQYDPPTGNLYRKNYLITGEIDLIPIDHVDERGYYVVKLFGKNIRAHRAVWAMAHGYWPDALDHIDRNKLNNRLSNLRLTDAVRNGHNKGLIRTNTSGVAGVSWCKYRSRWRAYLTYRGKQKSFGYFNSIEEAAEARDKGARSLYSSIFTKTQKTLGTLRRDNETNI